LDGWLIVTNKPTTKVDVDRRLSPRQKNLSKVQYEVECDQARDLNVHDGFSLEVLVNGSRSSGEVPRSTSDDEETVVAGDETLVAQGTNNVGASERQGKLVEATLDGEFDEDPLGVSWCGDDLDLTECGDTQDVGVDRLGS